MQEKLVIESRSKEMYFICEVWDSHLGDPRIGRPLCIKGLIRPQELVCQKIHGPGTCVAGRTELFFCS